VVLILFIGGGGGNRTVCPSLVGDCRCLAFRAKCPAIRGPARSNRMCVLHTVGGCWRQVTSPWRQAARKRPANPPVSTRSFSDRWPYRLERKAGFGMPGLLGDIERSLAGCVHTGSSLWEELECLSVETLHPDDGAEKTSVEKIERDDLIAGDAVEVPLRPEPQSAGPAKSDGAVRREDADKMTIRGIIFPDACDRVGGTERRFAGNHEMPVRRDGEIERAQSGVRHEAGRKELSAWCEDQDRIVPFAGRADAGGEKQPALVPEGEAAWKRHDVPRKNIFARSVETGWKGHDRAHPPKADVIASIRAEIPAAGVEPGDSACVAYHPACGVERENTVVAAVEVKERAGAIDTKPARIDDPAIIAEAPRRVAAEIKAQERAISIAVAPGGAGDKETYH